MALTKDVLKRFDRAIRGAPIGAAWKRVEGNEVDFAAEPAEQFDQSGGILGTIVHICEEHIFKGQPIAFCQGVFATGGEEGLERMELISGWHDLLPEFVGGGIQRNGQVHFQGSDLLDS